MSCVVFIEMDGAGADPGGGSRGPDPPFQKSRKAYTTLFATQNFKMFPGGASNLAELPLFKCLDLPLDAFEKYYSS